MKTLNKAILYSSLLLLATSPVLAEELDAEWGAAASSGQAGSDDPFGLSPEDFFSQDLSVYSPAKKLQKLKNIPSATYVMTADDIRRSAAVHLIDVFRLIPGIEVARVSAHEWAITSRGFNQVFGNKILLLVDGNPVETPIFNGILWENINIPLEIIERIEVVRGPGASVWGTRAMNGLINVITKDSFTFPYHTLSFGAGTEQLASAYARTGGIVTENLALQAYAKFDKYDSSEDITGRDLNDEWDIFTGNIRADIKPTERDSVRINSTVSVRDADFELGIPTIIPPYQEDRTGHRDNNRTSLNFAWTRQISEDSIFNAEWTNLYEKREDFILGLEYFYSELELRHRLKVLESHDLTYGVNARAYSDSTVGSDTLRFEPEDKSLEYYRAFFHDEITLVPETLTFTLGSRFEENTQVGFNVMPTARLLWNATEKVSFWGAVSRTTGAPSRIYDDIRMNAAAFEEESTGLPALLQVMGNRDLKSEKLLAYEVGTWIEPVPRVYASITGFYLKYDDLVNNIFGEPTLNFDEATGNPYLFIPYDYRNELSANTLGAEAALDWKVTDWYNISATYGLIKAVASPKDSLDKGFAEDSPRHTGTFRNHFTLMPEVELDVVFRYVDTLPWSEIDSYLEGDVRIGWRYKDNFRFDLIGRNLLDNGHQEFGPLVFNTPLSEVSRSVFFRSTYSF